MKKVHFSFILAGAFFLGVINADPVTVNDIGVGARAFSFANNYVALSNDMSGIFWNPAALSFLPVREFQAAFDILDNRNTVDLSGVNKKSDVRRIRLSDAGFLASIPTSKGGLTFAGSVQTPYIFDDNPSFKGAYTDDSNRVINVDQDYKGYGGLTYISGAFGLQVAPGFGIGVTASLVTGSEKTRRILYLTTNGSLLDIVNDDYDLSIDRGYIGYDFRFGLFYAPSNIIRLGMRLSLPQQIWFDEDWSETYPGTDVRSFSPKYSGKLLSSYSGAIGAAMRLPFLTVSTELRARAPYDIAYPDEKIPQSSAAAQMKMGAGIGVEVPIYMSKVLVRGGYSWDQYDPFVFVRQYDNENIIWDEDALNDYKFRSLVTCGLAYVDDNWCIEGAYGYQTWNFDSKFDNVILAEHHQLHRFTISFAVRY